MKSRMEKYNNIQNDSSPNRSERNENLYRDVQKSELEDFNINSNIAVLGDNKNELSIEEVQRMVRKRYTETPKRRSIAIEVSEYDEKSQFDETRDYDINSVLSKARSERVTDYQTDRLKKLRDTQYDILRNLDLDKIKTARLEDNVYKASESTMSKADDKLMTLIQTITSKEYKEPESNNLKEELQEVSILDPLDILSDLKGDDHTRVTEAVTPDMTLEDLSSTVKSSLSTEQPTHTIKDQVFFTDVNAFTASDFDDFNDLKEDVKKSKTLITILIVLIIIAFIFGAVVLLNTILDLGWF